MRLRCMSCTKSVSTDVPDDTVVRAWVECPECLEAKPAGVPGKLTAITVEVDGMSMNLQIDGKFFDPEVAVFSAEPGQPNPILQALHSTPPSKRFTLSIAVELP